MINHKMRVSLRAYYLIVAAISSLVFVSLVYLILLPTTLFPKAIIGIVLVYLFFYGMMGGFVPGWLGYADKDVPLRLIGMRPARMIGACAGLLIGVALGGRFAALLNLNSSYSKILGGIVGCIGFYFIGRYLGSHFSLWIGRRLEQNFLEVMEPPDTNSRPPKRIKLVYVFMSLLLPVIWMLMILVFRIVPIPVDFPSAWMPIVQIYVIALSVFSLIFPWLYEKRLWSINRLAMFGRSKAFTVFLFGVTISSMPALFGFFLYLFGASMIEVVVIMVASAANSFAWGLHIYRKEEPPAEASIPG